MFLDFFFTKIAPQLEDQSKPESNVRCSSSGDDDARYKSVDVLESQRRSRSSFFTQANEEGSDESFDVEEGETKDFDLDWVFEVILPKLKRGEMELPVASALVKAAHSTFKQENALIDLNFEAGIETVVVGDIHGQFQDLLLILEKYGRPGPGRRYIFNGDIVDRGPRSVACLLLLCALKSVVPEYLFVTRGNHESRTINAMSSTFALECVRNYSNVFYMECQRVFDELPVAYTLNSSIFVRGRFNVRLNNNIVLL